MLAISLVADSYIERIQKGLIDITLANSINAIVIAQQQAAIAAACAASAAAASSASSIKKNIINNISIIVLKNLFY